MIGTGTALLGMGLANAFGGFMQNRANNKATEAQKQGIDKAMEFQRQLWGQQQAYQAPYLNAGGQSMNLLGALMTPQNAPGAYREGNDYRITPPPPMERGIPNMGLSGTFAPPQYQPIGKQSRIAQNRLGPMMLG